MLLRRLWLTDFRNYGTAVIEPAAELTAIVGENGQGKTNILEAIAFLATLESFRGAPADALVRGGAEAAVIRAEVERDGRELLLEAELRGGRTRVLVNRQRLARTRDLLGALRVTVFAPDDLALVKGGPAERRRFLDDTVVAAQPRLDAVRTDVDRILRQRNALLRQVGGSSRKPSAEVEATLDVWDAKLADHGEALVRARLDLLAALEPVLGKAYDHVSSSAAEVSVRYEAPWREVGLASALAAGRTDDLRRGVSLIGPHRDELVLCLHGRPARGYASQGEQRSLALALRLAAHDVVTAAAGSPPVLVLDDVFSELDDERSRALLQHLPSGQVLLSTAGDLPPGASPAKVIHVTAGTLT